VYVKEPGILRLSSRTYYVTSWIRLTAALSEKLTVQWRGVKGGLVLKTFTGGVSWKVVHEFTCWSEFNCCLTQRQLLWQTTAAAAATRLQATTVAENCAFEWICSFLGYLLAILKLQRVCGVEWDSKIIINAE
jgi:hypothetical protein